MYSSCPGYQLIKFSTCRFHIPALSMNTGCGRRGLVPGKHVRGDGQDEDEGLRGPAAAELLHDSTRK